MKTVDFTQHLLSIQTELFRFAFKLTADSVPCKFTHLIFM